ncbi:Vitamin B12 import ATP-binding protein BtuD [Methylobacterium crusticola]|uniref:Vitamin B12 import ATP-binding protein BtuD n=1 Tax=Methylobacterium crusticola TaxID=1697972 RepID=A0ABQ4R7S2_9HYPH|nr:ATP-binding cassette domain-containing protein [Methylobacterium crusticola]GJD53718.1 Vitamin B12 import ATP-binding protein BtuD [Methylobacterium crusticola]
MTEPLPAREAPADPALRRAALLFAATLAAVAAGPFVLDAYTVNILIRALLYAVVALTVDVLWGYTGILTFGQSAFFGIGAYAAGLAFTHLGFSPGVAVLALVGGIAAAGLVGALVGWLAFGYGVTPIYVSVITLVLPIVVTQLLFSGGTFTGSSSGLSGFDTLDISIEAWFWLAGGACATLTFLAWIALRSDAGRLLVAIRENEGRCQYLGIDTARLKIGLMALSAAVAAVAGYLYAGFTDVIAPELAGFVFGTQIVIWVALGGRGTLIGPVVGAVVIEVVSAYLSGELPYVWNLVIGAVFVLVIVAAPGGAAAMVRRLWIWTGRGRARAGPGPAIEVVPAAGGGPLPDEALALEDVSRRFGSLAVLQGVSFRVRPGELLSLVGPNGAGKTTLMRCIADGTERSGGGVRIGGHAVGRGPPAECVAYGLGRKFQTANVFDGLTVAESLRVARARRETPSLWRRSATLRLPAAAARVVAATGLDERLADEVVHLSHGLKQALELAMVLALEPRVVLLDEPTAGLTKPERTLIGTILTDLVASERLCVVLVEHDLDFVRQISSRIIVLHQGRVALDGSVAEVVGSELVRSIYAGEPQALAEA